MEIYLSSDRVSRQHAAIHFEDDQAFIEDLGSRNGTYLNGKKIEKREPLTPSDQLAIGEFVFRLAGAPATILATKKPESDLHIREQVHANSTNQELFAQNPVQKLQIVLEITQTLSTSTEVNPLLENLLGRLLHLFPRADRGLIIRCEGDNLVVRAQQSRRGGTNVDFSFSRTIVAKSLADGMGILSDDLVKDDRFQASQSIRDSETLSLICVPLIAKDGRRLGIVQLDRIGSIMPFQIEDLRLLTTICLQVAVVLENAVAQAERFQHALLRKELSIARDVQMGYLPTDFSPKPGYQIFASIQPARDVSGDLYDFIALPSGKVAFLVGDVSGKGLPAAMFMIAVRTLSRHMAPLGGGPVATVTRLNHALAADNPAMMFVTLSYGIFDPKTGEVIITSAGHPPPLLVKRSGAVEEIAVPPGQVLGFAIGDFRLADVRLTLQPGETLVLYSDGVSEAFAPDGEAMFGVESLQNALSGSAGRPLVDCAAAVNEALQDFSGNGEIQDDQTLLLLRRL